MVLAYMYESHSMQICRCKFAFLITQCACSNVHHLLLLVAPLAKEPQNYGLTLNKKSNGGITRLRNFHWDALPSQAQYAGGSSGQTND